MILTEDMPLHPDLFDGQTPILEPATDEGALYRVRVRIITISEEAIVVRAKSPEEAEQHAEEVAAADVSEYQNEVEVVQCERVNESDLAPWERLDIGDAMED